MKKFIALTLALIMSFSCFSLVSFAEETETTMEHLTEVSEGYVGIYTIEDLYCVRNDLTANYILMNDIDLSEATAEGGDWNYEGRGWNPIGSNDVYSNNEFSGVFDGNNYCISGLNIDIASYPAGTGLNRYIGLFACVSGTIRNLSVNGKISTENTKTYDHGNNNPNYYFGGICAYVTSTGKIENCINNVSISIYSPHIANGPSPNLYLFQVSNYIGGITGYNEGTIKNCINNAVLKVAIKTNYRAFGYCAGIAGTSSSPATVSCCINNGNINAISNGYRYSNRSTCYVDAYGISSNNVSHCFNAGKIIALTETTNEYQTGYADSFGVSEYKATSCYNVGETNGFAISGSGSNSSSNCYYLEGVGENSAGATSLTESQMKLQSMYADWDFDTVWTMEGREDYPYPELRDVPLVLPEDSKTEITGTVTVTGEAKVGSTLTAEIKDISPADSTFEYEWKADGEVVGTDTSYTITQDDVGKEITLTIKGNGEFKGEFSSSAIVGECVHSLGEYVNNNDATCEKNETKSAVCEKCSEILTEEIEGTKLPHSFKNYIYDENATCTADGTETAKCENCDATDTIIAENTMVEHVFSDSWTIDKEATCAEEGVKSHHCKNCNATKDESVLNKLAHIYDAEVTEATCDKDGKVVYTCSCGDTYSKVLYATGHKDNDGNGRCDECPEYIEDSENENENKPDCKCICHETGIHSFLYRIFSYIQRYFKIDLIGKVFKLGQICKCGEYHY